MNWCHICGEEAWFKVGVQQTPLCVTHFRDWLAERKKLVSQ